MSWTEWERVQGDDFEFAETVSEKRTHLELEGRVARVSINRPEKYNAVTNRTMDEMFRAFYDASHDPMVGVIVLTGVGDHLGTGGRGGGGRWGVPPNGRGAGGGRGG